MYICDVHRSPVENEAYFASDQTSSLQNLSKQYSLYADYIVGVCC